MPKKQPAWMTKLEKAKGCVWVGIQVDGNRVLMRRGARATAPERQMMLATVGERVSDLVDRSHPSYGLLLGLIGKLGDDFGKADHMAVGKQIKVKPEGCGVCVQLCGNATNPDAIVNWGRFDGNSVGLRAAAVCVVSLAEIKGEVWVNRGATMQELVGALQVMTALYQEAEQGTTPRFGEARPLPVEVVKHMIFAIN